MFRTAPLLTLPVLISVSFVGCSDPPAIRQYEINSETEPQFTSELLRREFPPIPFRWKVPDVWTLAANDQFSVRAWNAGPPTAQARVTLGQFPARTGIPAQVLRWRRQLGLDSDDVDAAMKCVEPLRTKNGAGSFATVEGDSETILAFILPIESQFWIFRFRGPNATTKAEGDNFRLFCESLEYVAPKGAAPPQQTSAPTPSSAAEPPGPAEDSATPSDETPSPPASVDEESDNATDETPSPTTETDDAPSTGTPPSDTADSQPADDAAPEGDE